ncbi:DUF6359 domain-containing protein [Flammeovirga kamogawensis]|uniref:Lamin tail domain-containing protein n=1 Tax=Flammeovirga kamogawensis TaxID=373891 RepID=A0ABX8H4N7_9BACT|nr:DUF6359 domain-containing protein [Flammeovirga kamogawensis]MBB6461740.1 hypothetical protein [Flammeovirga kamogawensis]QWG10658.1 lamin tail domain-containing protein [Flammeovirga kamogawensis]TRX63762.1 lamin tail domain-containing protein [Flammeovirga kamogawensis]
MKNKQLFVFLKLLIATSFLGFIISSCNKDEPEGPGNPGTDPENPIEMETTHTIMQLQEMYDGSDLFDITEDVVIGGVLSSSDSTGNVYKSLFIQDDSGYGIQLKVNKTDLYADYSIGQTIYVKCNGLMMGQYGGLIQLGGEYEGKIGNIEEDVIEDHIFGGAKGAAPTAVTLDLDNKPSAIEALYSTWVSIPNVQFVDVDSTFTNGTFTTNRNVTTAEGNTVTVRTSNYATFANEVLPSKSGVIEGVLTAYNGTLQLTINEVADINFTGDRFEITAGEGEGTLANPFDLEAAAARLGQTGVWVKGYIIGSVNGVSLEDDFVAGASGESSASNFVIATSATETDPTKGMPVQLTTGFVRDGLNLKENPTLIGKAVWVKGDIQNYFNIPGVKNVVSYSLDGTTEPDAPEGLIGQGEDIMGDQLTNTTLNFSTWNEVKSLAMWEAKDMSAAVNAYGKGATISWMVSKTAIDFSSVADARLIVTEELKFFTGFSDIQVLASSDYSGSGDPTTATWTALEVDGTRAETGVIETQFKGTGTVYIAFKYTATDEASMSWTIETVKFDQKEVEVPAEGDGTLTNAYNVPAIRANQGDKDNKDYKWVKGKIVGYIKSNKFVPGATDAELTNLAIAIDSDETSASKIITVQLPSGYIRDALNLGENPAMLNKDVWLNGSLETYYGFAGVKYLQSYSLDGVTEEGDATPPPTGIVGQGEPIAGTALTGTSINFTTYNVVESAEIWKASAGKASINGYNNGANTSWLITASTVDFSGFTAASLIVKENINYGKGLDKVMVKYSSDYTGTGDPAAANWTAMPVYGDRADGGATTTQFDGSSLGAVYVAFIYTNNDNTDASSWSIESVVAGEKEEDTTPPVDPNPEGINLGDNAVSGFSDLIISEYVEGSSYNKFIEIFNGTGSEIDLSDYSLSKDSNGSDVFTKVALEGTLPNGATLLLSNSQADLTLLPNGVTSRNSSAVNFNGDDQVALFKGDVEIDRIGIAGDISFGIDVTFRRAVSIRAPKPGENDPRDNGEWDSYPKNTTEDLGSHTIN